MEQNEISLNSDTIAAIATPFGTGGVAILRISGPKAIQTVSEAWNGRNLHSLESHRATLGKYISKSGVILDEALATIFRGPKSFTGEDTVELSVHGSQWIQREILNDLIMRGVRPAGPGEFTQRAFLNGKLDLAQAEGVADLISATSKAAHTLALSQTTGSLSRELENLRNKMIEFASLMELELDFSEEDVTFANRSKLLELAEKIKSKTQHLADSFSSGTVFKEGMPTVIAGHPNAGKSSLLNLLANEDKAIVTDIPGTTRDTIETTATIKGILFRFTDTAGLRETEDAVESIGIERTRSKMGKARIIIWIIDTIDTIESQLELRNQFAVENPEIEIITLLNKIDHPDSFITSSPDNAIPFSAKTGQGLDELYEKLYTTATRDFNPDSELVITNARHHESLVKTSKAMERAIASINEDLPGDLTVQDIREAIHHLGTITGTVTPSHLLHHIFSHFCIGK